MNFCQKQVLGNYLKQFCGPRASHLLTVAYQPPSLDMDIYIKASSPIAQKGERSGPYTFEVWCAILRPLANPVTLKHAHVQVCPLPMETHTQQHSLEIHLGHLSTQIPYSMRAWGPGVGIAYFPNYFGSITIEPRQVPHS